MESKTSLPSNWIELYYHEIERDIYKDLKQAIKSDTKSLNLNDSAYRITQIELWEAQTLLKSDNTFSIIKECLEQKDDDKWFLTLASISEGKNYLITEHKQTKEELCDILDAKEISQNCLITENLLLRKEIIKKYLDKDVVVGSS